MKYIKITVCWFIVTLFMSFTGVNAADFKAFTGITLGSFSATYTSSSVAKSVTNYQYITKTGATDLITGGERAVEAQTVNSYGVESGWITIGTSASTWGQNTNMYQETYNLKIRAKKSTLAKVSYSGIWYLNANVVN